MSEVSATVLVRLCIMLYVSTLSWRIFCCCSSRNFHRGVRTSEWIETRHVSETFFPPSTPSNEDKKILQMLSKCTSRRESFKTNRDGREIVNVACSTYTEFVALSTAFSSHFLFGEKSISCTRSSFMFCLLAREKKCEQNQERTNFAAHN